MALLDLSRVDLLKPPLINENFSHTDIVKRWSEYPQPEGARFREKYWSGGTSQSSRGLGINAPPGYPLEGESQYYSSWGHKIGNTLLRSPFTQNTDDTFTINASPVTLAEAVAVESLGSNGGMRRRPLYLSGMLATDFLGYGYWVVRVRRRLRAKNDFGAIWWQGPPGTLRNEIDFEFIGEEDAVYLNMLNQMDRYWAKRPTPLPPQQVRVAHDWSVWSELQMVRTRETITLARDNTVLKQYANDGVEMPMQLVVNLAKDGGWIKQKGWIGDGTERSSLDIDSIQFYPQK